METVSQEEAASETVEEADHAEAKKRSRKPTGACSRGRARARATTRAE
jgi:hypothetical protein